MILSFQWRATTQKSPCRRAWGFGIWKPLSRWITKDGKYSNLITSEFHHISSRLFIKGGLIDISPPFTRKVAGERVTVPGVRIPHFPQKRNVERRSFFVGK